MGFIIRVYNAVRLLSCTIIICLDTVSYWSIYDELNFIHSSPEVCTLFIIQNNFDIYIYIEVVIIYIYIYIIHLCTCTARGLEARSKHEREPKRGRHAGHGKNQNDFSDVRRKTVVQLNENPVKETIVSIEFR